MPGARRRRRSGCRRARQTTSTTAARASRRSGRGPRRSPGTEPPSAGSSRAPHGSRQVRRPLLRRLAGAASQRNPCTSPKRWWSLGGAFLVCGLIARAGVRIGLPTIPLFMLAGVIFGPSTPGFDLVARPGRAGARRPPRADLPAVLPRPGVLPRPARRRRRRLVARPGSTWCSTSAAGCCSGSASGGERARPWSSQASSASRPRPWSPSCWSTCGGSATARAGSSSGSSSSRTCSSPSTWPCSSRCSAGPTGPLTAVGRHRHRVRLPARPRAGGPVRRRLVGRLIDTKDEEIVIVVVVGLAVLAAGVAEHSACPTPSARS